MRLHRLSVTAFGPFKDEIRVDFDTLGDAGLFLLSGPTGAGKSSILDAVCFALYGDVPGDRASAKRLRCDHADPSARPVVELEVTLGGRRFLIERSPAWERPKRRGVGSTTEQARVVAQEWVDGEWTTRSTRLDEAGHLVTALLGMNLPQFCQVALLPQGRFQAFLRARSEERHALLQQVFRTGRFDQVERWLQDHRKQARRDVEATQREVGDLVSRICEVVDSAAPDDWADDPTLLTRWVDESAAALGVTLATSRDDLAAAQERLDEARDVLASATALSEARRAHDAAVTRLARLEERSALIDELRLRLDRARRAEPMQVLATVARQAERKEASAQDDAARARARVASLLAQGDTWVHDDLDLLEPGAARELVREAVRHQQALAGLEPLRRERADLASQEQRLAVRCTQLERATASHVARATATVDRLERELASATAAAQGVAEQLLAAKEHWLEVREARLEGIAAEIAGSLVVGGCCPVCGSHEHPSPAAAAPGAPGVDDERSARRHVDDLEATALVAQETVTRCRVDLAAARDAALVDPHAEETAEVRARREGLAVRRAAVDAQLAEALRGQPSADVDVLQRHWADVERAAEALIRSLEHVENAAVARRRSADDLEETATRLGFDDTASALEATLDAAAVKAIELDVRRHDDEVAKAQEGLALAPAPTEPSECLPDLTAASARVGEAERRVQALTRAAHDAERRSTRLSSLREALDRVVLAWEPQRSALAVAVSMAGLVSGTSTDNRLQMRLSAYVLASRLSQVVAAANVRLATMSDHRFALEHTGRRGAGETRGGLSLLVRDDWSGESRDPATLSGGETFVVSLALALGLADVITHEAGGARVDTLFVDEGFGSLDADTLEDVMTTLDSLRDGGRSVGVVSHVPEMQTRIPAQLRVHKSRVGSRVTQHLG